MTLYALFAAVILIGSLLPVNAIPPLRRKARGWNSMTHIGMPDPSTSYPGYWLPIYAQELAEWWLAWFGALLLALPIALLLSGTVFAPASVLAVVIAFKWRGTVTGERLIEYVGWGVEREYGLQDNPPRYGVLEAYAERFWRVYPHLFENRGLTSRDALVGLRRWRWLAKVILVLIRPRVQRQGRKLGLLP